MTSRPVDGGPRPLDRAHRLYKSALSPMLHGLMPGTSGCRFQPTCSEYAVLAYAQHGWLRGSALALWRVLRCHPLAKGGWDPVPEQKQARPIHRKPNNAQVP